MLNRVMLMGRITHDLEVRQTKSGIAVLRFTVAVDRGYVKQGEEGHTDFISCVAWRQQAEFINRCFSKGKLILLEGRLQISTYTGIDGVKRNVSDVIISSVYFAGDMPSESTNPAKSDKQHKPAESEKSEPISDISLEDFEEILGDEGVPF